MKYVFYVVFLFLHAFTAFSKSVKIAFNMNNYLGVRGTEVATFDYAVGNEDILGNVSYLLLRKGPIIDPRDCSSSVRQKYEQRFGERVFEYTTMEQADAIMAREHIDIFYTQKWGTRDDLLSKVAKNAAHAVFDSSQIHGDSYAAISQWLAEQNRSDTVATVPYMVNKPYNTEENLRAELGIPLDALVFGCHGGASSFDIGFAQEAVKSVAQESPNIYFVFLNIQKFCELPNVIFLPGTADMLYKSKFINSCDVLGVKLLV